MKLNDIKKQLNKEYDALTPDCSIKVLKEPLQTVIDDIAEKKASLTKLSIKRFAYSMLAVCLVVAIALFTFFVKPDTTTESYIAAASVIKVEINPSIEIVTDSDDKIVSVCAVNRDAEVLLSQIDVNNELISQPVTTGVKLIVDTAAKLGYIEVTADNSMVKLSVGSAIDDKGRQIADSLASEVKSYFKSNGIYGVVIEGVLTKADLLADISSTGGSMNESNDVKDIIQALKNRRGYAQNEIALFEAQTNGDVSQAINIAYKIDVLQSEIESMRVKYEMLDNLNSLNELIKENEDNPLKLDGFVLLGRNTSNKNAELRQLIGQFKREKQYYDDKYETSLNSVSFMTMYGIYSAIDYDKLSSELDDVRKDIEKLDRFLNEVLTLIDTQAVDYLSSLIESVPSDMDEYLSSFGKLISKEATDKMETYRHRYEQNRNQLSDSEYENYLANIEKKYGSLENYWKNKKN